MGKPGCRVSAVQSLEAGSHAGGGGHEPSSAVGRASFAGVGRSGPVSDPRRLAGVSASRQLTGQHSVRYGSPEELHEIIRESVGEPQVVLCIPDGQAAVVGSRQATDLVVGDADVKVVRRRSGGGLVLVDPDAAVWIDVVVPPGDERFGSDVRSGMIEVGRRWRRALIALGADPDRIAVHEGEMRTSAWGDLLCFAGVGAGEVLFDGAKLVGISQRRSSAVLRFQCQVHREDPTDRLMRLIGDRPTGEPMRPAVLGDVVGPAVDGQAVAAALAAEF